jgi:hypothetical protein
MQKLTPGGMAFDQIFTVLKGAAGGLAALSSEGSKILSQINAIEATAADASNNPAKYDPADKSEPMPDLWKTIEPVFRLHDDVQKWLMENEELFKIPYLSDAVNNIGEYMNALVYKFLATLLEPSLQETRNAVKAARDEAQKAGKQSDIWGDESKDSNPSHSDIAKDHFSNVLNQPAGLVATVITNWTTRMVVRCWDEKDQDADDMINHILTILHHPAFAREKNDPQKYMFSAVETWWNTHSDQQRSDLRKKLSKDSAKDYYDHHDHTIQASDFRGPNKLCYKHGFEFPGSRPNVNPPPSQSLLGKTKELIVDVSNQLNAAGQAVVDGTVEVVNVVGDTANDVVDAVGDGFNTVGRGIGDGAEAVGGAVIDAGNWVGDTATDVGNTINNAMPWNWSW